MNTADKTHTFEVKVHTGSSKRGISIKNGAIELFTPKRPVNGEANIDAIKIISGYWGVPKSRISIIKGETSKVKVFVVTGPIKAGKNKYLL
jgi:uncharacterized protein YggU (UPF0235/DUF167 family)